MNPTIKMGTNNYRTLIAMILGFQNSLKRLHNEQGAKNFIFDYEIEQVEKVLTTYVI